MQTLEGATSTVHLYDAEENGVQLRVKPITKYKYDDSQFVEGDLVAANSKFIAYAIRGNGPNGEELGHVRVIDQEAGRRDILKGHWAPISHITFFGDQSSVLCSTDVAGTLMVWKISVDDATEDGKLNVTHLASCHTDGVEIVRAQVGPCLDYGGAIFTLERWEGNAAVKMWSMVNFDLETEDKETKGEVSLSMKANFHFENDNVHDLSVSPGGRYLAVASEKGAVELIDTAELKKIGASIPFQSNAVHSVNFVAIDGSPPASSTNLESERLDESAIIVGAEYSSELKVFVGENLVQNIFIDVSDGKSVANHVAVDPSHSYFISADTHRNRICIFRISRFTRDGISGIKLDQVNKYVCSGPILSFSVRTERTNMGERTLAAEEDDRGDPSNGIMEIYATQKSQVVMLSLDCALRAAIRVDEKPSAPAITPEKSMINSLLEAVSGSKASALKPPSVPQLQLNRAVKEPQGLLSPSDIGSEMEPGITYSEDVKPLPPIAEPVDQHQLASSRGMTPSPEMMGVEDTQVRHSNRHSHQFFFLF